MMFFTLLAGALIGQPTVKLDPRCDPLPNLLYHLDVVSGYLPYTQSPVLSKLWEERIAPKAEDAKLLETWRETMRRLETTGQAEFNPKLLYSVATIQTQAELTREIGLTSSSQFEFTRRIAREVEPAAARELGKVIARFQPAFMSWWTEEAEAKGKEFQKQAAKLLTSEKLQKLTEALVHFYQPDLPDGFVVPVQFMYKPRAREASHGGQVGSAAVMEFFEGDSPANKVDITLHELSHFFFRKAGVAKHESLATKFAKTTDPSRMAVFSIMNEALATSLNNGMVADALMPAKDFKEYRDAPLSWYSNLPIDSTAKSSYDWLKGYVQNGGTLHDAEFPAQYVSAVRKGLGPMTDAPTMQLFGVNLIWHESWPKELNFLPGKYIQSTVTARFSDTKLESALSDALKLSPMLSTLIILKPGEVEQLARHEPLLKKLEPSIRQALTAGGSALAGTRRKSGLALYIIVAADLQSVEKELKRLAAQKTDLAGVLP